MGFSAESGVKQFKKLVDTPNTYTAQKGKLAKVNTAETALVFSASPEQNATKFFDGLVNTPDAGYLLPWDMVIYRCSPEIECKLVSYFVASIGEYLYIGGGRWFTGAGYEVKYFYKYKPSTKEWTRLADLPVGLSIKSSAACHDGVIYIYGDNVSSLYAYTIATDTWTTYTGFGSYTTGYVIAALTDFLYVILDNATCQRFDYTLHTWEARAAPPGASYRGGEISDELYIVDYNSPYKVYKHNKAGNTWDDQVQNAPFRMEKTCYIADVDGLWYRRFSGEFPIPIYKYTPGGGWAVQFNYPRLSDTWDNFVQLTGETDAYCFFGISGAGAMGEDVGFGAIHKYVTTEIWDLCDQAFAVGDILIIDAGGVPVSVERNGVLQFITTEFRVIYIVEAGTYRFSLDKDYSYGGVKLWRGTWG